MARLLVSIDARHHEFYREMAGKDRGKDAPFEHMKDLFVACAAVGLRNGVPVPFAKREGIFDTNAFSQDEWIAFEAAYVAKTQDLEALQVSDRRGNEAVLSFIEEFANAGVGIVKEQVSGRRPEVDLALLLLEAPTTI